MKSYIVSALKDCQIDKSFDLHFDVKDGNFLAEVIVINGFRADEHPVRVGPNACASFARAATPDRLFRDLLVDVDGKPIYTEFRGNPVYTEFRGANGECFTYRFTKSKENEPYVGVVVRECVDIVGVSMIDGKIYGSIFGYLMEPSDLQTTK